MGLFDAHFLPLVFIALLTQGKAQKQDEGAHKKPESEDQHILIRSTSTKNELYGYDEIMKGKGLGVSAGKGIRP
jgi:hypothetical protein